MPRMKKDFSEFQTENVYSDVEKATTRKKGQQGTANKAEQEARAEALQTSGRKGCKAVRINMAFTPSNHEFIKVMSRASGRTLTEFTNLVIAAYQREHPEIMEKARAFLDEIESGMFSNLFDGDDGSGTK